MNDAGLDVNDRKVGQPLANARALAADRLGIQLGVPDPKFAHMSPKAQLLLSNRLGVATSNNPWEQNIPDEHIQTEYDRHIRDIQSARKNLLDGGIPVEEVDTMFPVPKFEEFRFRHSNAFGRKANIAPKK